MSSEHPDLAYSNEVFAWLQNPGDMDAPNIEPWHEARLIAEYGIDSFAVTMPISEIEADLLLVVRLKLAGFGNNVINQLAREDAVANMLEAADDYIINVGVESSHQITHDETAEVQTVSTPLRTSSRRSLVASRPINASDIELLLLDSGGKKRWQDQALCAQTDPESFFPEKGGSTREAKKVCLACEVREECLESAIANDERFGIWGGLSERERRKLKKTGAAVSEIIALQDDVDNNTAEASAGDIEALREDDRLYSPKIDHAGRIRQLVAFCELDDFQTEAIEYNDQVRDAFVTNIVRKVYHATDQADSKQASVDISRLTNYFIVDDIAKIWTLFDQDRDYWEDMFHLLKRFDESVRQIKEKQQEFDVDFSQTVERCMENAQFGLDTRSA